MNIRNPLRKVPRDMHWDTISSFNSGCRYEDAIMHIHVGMNMSI